MAEKEKTNHIRCRCIIEVLGKPKGHVERTIRDYVGKIKEDSSFIVLNELFADAKEQENLWSIFTELEIVFKDIKTLILFCFDYMPSSIEVIKPEEIVFKNTDISDFLNDLQARLHNLDMISKQLKAENTFLRRNMKASLNNAIAVLLKIRSMDIDEIAAFTGVPKDELQPLTEHLLKNNKIKEENGKYILIS